MRNIPSCSKPASQTALALLAFVAWVACNTSNEDSPLAPSEPVPTQVEPTKSEGETQISFVSADPPPGSTIAGCGPQIGGCTGRIGMRFRLVGSADGHVQSFDVYLHSTGLTACLMATVPSFEIAAEQPTDVDVRFDDSDDCPTPTNVDNMSAVLSGGVELGSRQEWALNYMFNP